LPAHVVLHPSPGWIVVLLSGAAAYLTAAAALAAILGTIWPLVAAIALVALVANVSAVSRLRWLAARVVLRPHGGGE